MKISVTFAAQNRNVKVEPGTPVLQAVRQADLPLGSDCGGKGRCGKCKVVVRRGVTPLSPLERECLSPEEITGKVRLACQARVVAPTRVKDGKSSFIVRAEGPWPIMISSLKSSMAG